MKYILHKKSGGCDNEEIIAEGTDEELVLRKAVPAIVRDITNVKKVVDLTRYDNGIVDVNWRQFEIDCVYSSETYIKYALREGKKYHSFANIDYWLTKEDEK